MPPKKSQINKQKQDDEPKQVRSTRSTAEKKEDKLVEKKIVKNSVVEVKSSTRTTNSKKVEDKALVVNDKNLNDLKDQNKIDAPKTRQGRGKGKKTEEEAKIVAPEKTEKDKTEKIENKDKTEAKKEEDDDVKGKRKYTKKNSIESVQDKNKAEKEPTPSKKVKINEETENVKKHLMKDGAAVDEWVYNNQDYHVINLNGKVYDCLMNQTNITDGRNNNKFYIVQALETDSLPRQHFLFCRWGRVGQRGQQSMQICNNIENCCHEYLGKVQSKSVKGDYFIIETDYTPQVSEADKAKLEQDAYAQSKLQQKVKELVKLIFDIKMMNKQMMEIGYDAQKMPLGKLAKSTIDRGFLVLDQISKIVNQKQSAKQSDDQELARLSSEFYSYIPHNFGFQRAPIIKTNEVIKQKTEMLESIEQIQIATRILDSTSENSNIIDSHYDKLNCNIQWVDPKSDKYHLLNSYVKNTHAKTHSNYSIDVMDIYEIKKDLDETRFKKEIGNRMLLWHGSRLTNYVGILSQGLRIAPKEAPVTGYMFGKGVYFADMVSKSANYCGASEQNSEALILLCDVALGEFNDKFYADYNAADMPAGKHSTRGCGKTAPPQSSYVEHEGCKIPLGVGEQQNLKLGSLLYNEYIVYDVAQIQFKYLLKLKYNYK